MNWIAFGWALLACAGVGVYCLGVHLVIVGFNKNKAALKAAGFVLIALIISSALGLTLPGAPHA